MQSTQEHRQQIIHENISKLIKTLTGFNEEDENFKLCETFSHSRIINHRYLSVNSHEIRRKIDGLAERFMINNYTVYGERFKKLCQQLIDDPLCSNHYEYDIQWSLLHFLLEAAQNPLNALAINKDKIQLDDDENVEEEKMRNERDRFRMDLAKSLLRNSLELQESRRSLYVESDLSEWSDDVDDVEENAHSIDAMAIAISQSNKCNPSELVLRRSNQLNPPQKPLPFTEFDSSKSDKWLDENVQYSWWNRSDWQTTVNSNYDEAKTCQKYQDSVKKYSGGLVKLPTVSTVSEWCLLREIIWMMKVSNSNIKAKFFSIDLVKSEITVNSNVSIPSATPMSIRSILNEFAEQMTKLFRLHQFMNSVFIMEHNSPLPPHTIECYASAMKSFLDQIFTFLLSIEIKLSKQNAFEIYSIVTLFNEMKPYFNLLNHLYTIHINCYIDFRITSGYECVIHLFGGILNEIDSAATLKRLNIASSLLLCSVKFYFHKFDDWWFEGRFNDWRNEFIIEKVRDEQDNDNGLKYNYRLQRIDDQSNEIIQLICDQFIESGYIISILFDLDKLNDMRGKNVAINNEMEFNFYGKFIELIFDELNKFKYPEELASEDQAVNTNEMIQMDNNVIEMSSNSIEECDPLLFLVFENITIDKATDKQQKQRNDMNEEIGDDDISSGYAFYQRLNKITEFHLPITQVIHKTLNSLLKSKISSANRYVLNIFINEYHVLDHIINLQRIFLLGAGDLMQTFYSNLFKSMNKDDNNWNNPYLLTVKLDGIISSKYPKMKNLFSIQFDSGNSNEKFPLDAINDLTLNYVVRESIRDIIHDDALEKYNDVFRFLLQIKWAIWTLENLRFPISVKRRKPYMPLTIVDLTFKRLALMRNWLIYSIQCIHSHLMTFVIQSMGEQLIRKMERVECLREIIELHDSYIQAIHGHCFRKRNDKNLRKGIEQLLHMVVVLNDEWNNIIALDEHGDDVIDGDGIFNIKDAVEQVDAIETTYINCHSFIAESLSKEVYTKNRVDLSALSAAFNCSCPY